MPVDVPWDAGPLWTDIQQRFEWPPTDEARVVELGIGWTNAGASFLYAGSSTGLDQNLVDGWPHDTGREYLDQVRALRGITGTTGENMKRVAWLATEFAADLTHTKESIARLIRDNAWLYTHMNNFFGWPDNEGRRRLIDRLVALINAFLDQMADRIAARGAGEPEIGRPEFPAGRLTDERWDQLAETIPGDPRRPSDGRVGESLRSIDDVLANPQLLRGKTPTEVEEILRGTPGWRVETLGQGAHAGQGWVFRQYNERGNSTGPQLRWHPGGGHHGPLPYWRVIGPEGGRGGIIR